MATIDLSQGSDESYSSGFDKNWSRSKERSKTFLDPRQRRAQLSLIKSFQRNQRGLGEMEGFDRYRNQIMSGTNALANRAQGFGGVLRGDYNQGMNRFSRFSQQQNPYLQQQIDQFGEDVGRQYREQILPGIGSDAQLAGQRGSSRQGIAEGLAAEGAMNQYARGVTDMRSRAYGQQQQAAESMAAMGLSGVRDMYGLAGDVMAQRGQLANQFGQTQLAANAMPFQIGAEVIGAPSVLSRSGGFTRSRGFSKRTAESSGDESGFGIGF